MAKLKNRPRDRRGKTSWFVLIGKSQSSLYTEALGNIGVVHQLFLLDREIAVDGQCAVNFVDERDLGIWYQELGLMIDGNEGWYQPCESCCIKIKRISSVLTSLPHPRQKANVSDAMAAENLSAKFETLLADS